MKIESLVKIAYEQYQSIFDSVSLKENLLSVFFRNNKFIGSKERKIIQELVYNSIRHSSLIDAIAIKNNISDFKSIMLISLIISEKYFLFSFEKTVDLIKHFSDSNFADKFIYEIIADNLNLDLKLHLIYIDDFFNNNANNNISVKYSFPVEFQKLLPGLSQNKIANIAKAYLHPAKTTIRANQELCNSAEIDLFLKVNQISYGKSDIYDDAFIINDRIAVNKTDAFNEGKFEIQDESSMLVAYAVNPIENDNILDACAGAGGKSLHLASLSNGKSNIYAYDTNNSKLRILEKRANKNKTKSIKILSKNKLKQLKFNKILIDAPCTGSGTICRNPVLKYRINNELVFKYTEIQKNIISFYSKLLKHGGELIYSTCSIIPDENKMITDWFMENHPEFKPLPLPDNIFFQKFGAIEGSNNITIYPDIHNSDGFYICKFIKKMI